MPDFLPNQRRQGNHSAHLPSRRSRTARATVVILAALVALATSGCVYLRLLEFKNQLSDFDKNFAVNVDDGLTINFLNPVILERDMWFIGLPPTVQDDDAEGTTWTYLFEKELPGGRRETTDHDVRMALRFSDGKMTQFRVGEELFAFIPKDAVLMTLKSLGKLKISLTSRKASLDIEEDGPGWDFPAPNRTDIVNTLGQPWSGKSGEHGYSTLVFRYVLQPSSPPAEAYDPETHGRPYQISIVFDSKDLISRITATFPFMGSITVNYEDPVEETE